MNTALAELPEENPQYRYGRTGTGFSSTNEPVRYGRTDTDFLSTNEPEIRPRSSIKFDVISSPNVREDIKLSWSGVVISMNDHELTVRMEDMTNRENPDEIVVISRDEIDDKDQYLVKPGALFYWHIGYRQGAKCPKERFSIIRFRRLSKWTANEIKEAENLAEDYANFFLTD